MAAPPDELVMKLRLDTSGAEALAAIAVEISERIEDRFHEGPGLLKEFVANIVLEVLLKYVVIEPKPEQCCDEEVPTSIAFDMGEE